MLVKETEPPQVLLGLVKRSRFQGNIYNFPGGKHNPPETLPACASRELYEETGLRVAAEDWSEVGDLTFRWPKAFAWDQHIMVYLSKTWSGQAQESDELTPSWFPVTELPLKSMWPADKLWVPRVLEGKYVTATFVYDSTKALIAHDVRQRTR